ncbi:hypothetical protein JTE90_028629 [Oedothorax gibbosus]|uniref:Uncharacterized protein n=1 Tax=Oedothorax gibbosus TaxID=931172 RepID=A0AAV6UXP7_9ARAC|nr:hypothetical protein JTE90_028629 [Oedothorax gibbosus]
MTQQQRPPGGGKTNLMVACEQGRTLEVKIILQKKPQAASIRDRTNKTALHYCAESGSLPCAQLVLASDPGLLDSPDTEGHTPLHIAVISGNKGTARFLLKHGADPDKIDRERHSSVHWAAVCSDTESLDLLLSHGANPSTPDILGAYPVHYAAQMCVPNALNGKAPQEGLNALRKLLEGGASTQCRDRDGREPLMWAASAGSSDAVLILFAAGANVTSTDKDGLTALHCAASRGHTTCVETLVTLCGSRVDTGDALGCTPLFYAAAQGHADAAQVLLKYGADPSIQDNKGRTPGHCAASKGQLEIMRILDSNGADLWIRNSRGNLPLHEAVQSGRKDLVQWLLQQCGRAVNATNMSGRTPLHIAAQKSNVEMCEVLIDYGAHVNPLMVNAKGFLMSPLDVSVYQGNQRCAKYLQLHGAVPATKVLENNEINRNLLFSLGNYAFTQNGRSDEEPAAIFDHPTPKKPMPAEEGHPPPLLREKTRTVARAGQQPPPIPQPERPPESLLPSVASEDVSDAASVHIHLTRDDLWSLWESLMQEITSDLSEGSEAGKTPREVKQLKPILTNVYVRTSSRRTSTSSRDVIAGESIMDKADEREEGPSRKKHSKSKKEDPKSNLPKVAEVESGPNHEWNEYIKEPMNIDPDNCDIGGSNQSGLDDFSDSVGSDTEHRIIQAGVKVTRLRKRRSEGRSWKKEPEESETSSGHHADQRGDNPYLKRYFQKQAKAAEVREYLSGVVADGRLQEEDEGDSSSVNKRHQDSISVKDRSHKHKVRQDYDDVHYSKQRKKSLYVDEGGEEEVSHKDGEGHRRRHRKKSVRGDMQERDDVFDNQPIEKEYIEDESFKTHHRRSSTFSKTDQDKMSYQNKKEHGDHRHRRKSKYDIDVSPNESSVSPRRSSRHHTESHDEASPDRHFKDNRRGSKKFLEVPAVKGRASSSNDGGEVSEDAYDKLHYHHYHHYHHHHHHHRPPLEKEASFNEEEQHVAEHHRKHKRHSHRKRLRLREEGVSPDNSKEDRNLSDGECYQYKRDPPYSDVDEQRSRSEMTNVSRQDMLSPRLETPTIVLTDNEKEDEIMEIKVEVDNEGHEISFNMVKEENVEIKNDERQLHLNTNHSTAVKILDEKAHTDKENIELHQIHENIEDTSKFSTTATKKDDSSNKYQDTPSKQEIKPSITPNVTQRTNIQGSLVKDVTLTRQNERSSKRKPVLKTQRSKSRTRSPKAKNKLSPEKTSVRKMSMVPKKTSPKMEARKLSSKVLKPTHSQSDNINPKEKDAEYSNEKSKCASSPIDMPVIKLSSVEGDTTDLLIENEAKSNTALNRVDQKDNETQRLRKDPKTGELEPVEVHEEPVEKSKRNRKTQEDSKNEKEFTEPIGEPTETLLLNEHNKKGQQQKFSSSDFKVIESNQSTSIEDFETEVQDSQEDHVIKDITEQNSDIQKENRMEVENNNHKHIAENFEKSPVANSVLPTEKTRVPKKGEKSDHQKLKEKLKCDTPTIDTAQNIVEDVLSEAESIASQKSCGDKNDQEQFSGRPSSSLERGDDADKLTQRKRMNKKPKSFKQSDHQKLKDKLKCDTPTIEAAKNVVEDVLSEAESIASQKSYGDKNDEELSFSTPSSALERNDEVDNLMRRRQITKNVTEKNFNENVTHIKLESGNTEHERELFSKDEQIKGESIETSQEPVPPQSLENQTEDDQNVTAQEKMTDILKETIETEVLDSTKEHYEENVADEARKLIEQESSLTESQKEVDDIEDTNESTKDDATTSLDKTEDMPIIIETQPDKDTQDNVEHLSADESTSEAETKFQSDDSEDIQPEPDLKELFLISHGNVQHSPVQQEPGNVQEIPLIDDDLSDVQHDEIIQPVFEAEEATNESVASNLNDLSMGRPPSAQENINKTLDRITNEQEQVEELYRDHQTHDVFQKSSQSAISPQIYANESKISQRKLSQQGKVNGKTETTDKRSKDNLICEEKVHRDMSSQTMIVRGETEFYVSPQYTPRSISVQTGKDISIGLPSKLYKKKTRNSSTIKTSHKTTAVQTEKHLAAQMDTENMKEVPLSVINEDRLNEKHEAQISGEEKRSRRKSKNASDELTVTQNSNLTSPERHNPSAIFYKAVGKDIYSSKKVKEPKSQNREALFYTMPALREKEPRTSMKNTQEISSKSKPESRSSIRSRDRSLESEKADAIANSAFRKMNANGELTVFNSSHINPSLDIERKASNSHFEMKPSCQRRGEYPTLEKPGFLWVHFGSGSSPIHTLRKKPNFTSQKLKRDTTKRMDSISEKIDDSRRVKVNVTSKNIPKKIHTNKENVTKQGAKFIQQRDKDKLKNTVNEKSLSKVPTLASKTKSIGQNQNEEKTKINETPRKVQIQQSISTKDKNTILKSQKNFSPRKTEKTHSVKEGITNTYETPRTIPKTTAMQDSGKKEQDVTVIPTGHGKAHRNKSQSPKKTIPIDNSEINTNYNGDGHEKSIDNNQSEKDKVSNNASNDINNQEEDQYNKNPRLSDTAKSSSFEEGDVRLLIERKTDPGVSIKIRMKDRNKSKDNATKNKEFTDISSTQGESDASYIKDSGYISTSESIYNHRRSITIDLGHTKAKINAGMKADEYSNSKEKFHFPSVEDTNVNVLEEGDKTAIQKSSRKSMSSKLPILEGQRQRSNSLVFMDYNRSPRRDSFTGSEMSESDVLFNNSLNRIDSEKRGSAFKNIHTPEDKEPLNSNIHRQTAQGTGRSRIPLRKSSIPIYKASSEGNLHTVDKPSPRLKKHSLSTPSIHQATMGSKSQSSHRTMCSIREMSSSPSELHHSDSELNRSSANKLKLPSILLYEPDDLNTAKRSPKTPPTRSFPAIQTSPRSQQKPGSRASIFSREGGSLQLPLLQQPIKCRCSIQPQDQRRSRSAVDCVANIHFLTDEEMAEFDSRFFHAGRSFSCIGKSAPAAGTVAYRSLKTQALKRLNAGRRSADRSVTFHVDHLRERNTFKLPTEKLQRNKKWQVVFTIGKTGDQKKSKK